MIKSPAALDKLVTVLEGESLDTLPGSMRRAVQFMLSGAAATAVWGIFSIVAVVASHDQLVGANGRKLTSGEIVGGAVDNLLFTIVLAAIWVLVARMNQRGRGWARITATVLFVVWSLWCFLTIGGVAASALSVINVVLVLLIWAAGAGALFYLWRPDSSEFFQSPG